MKRSYVDAPLYPQGCMPTYDRLKPSVYHPYQGYGWPMNTLTQWHL